MSVNQSWNSLREPYAPVWSGQIADKATAPDAPTSHPAFERLLKRLPEEHRSGFTAEQLRALALASVPPPPNHQVEYRVSLPFFGRRYYLALFVGRERRARSRLVAEGQLPASQIIKPDPVAWTLMLFLGGFGVMLCLFIAKAMFGIELGESIALPEFMPHLTDADLRPN